MTTFSNLYQQVLLRARKYGSDGEVLLAAKQGINDAHKAIARVYDFDDLMVWDKTNAFTADSTAAYHLTTDWGLTRPKDLHTLKLMDGDSSRKLVYVPPSRLDDTIPYPEGIGEGRPKWYTRRGNEVELIRIPDAVYAVYVYYSQWPNTLADDDDETPYTDLDDVIIQTAVQAVRGIMEEEYVELTNIAKALIFGAKSEHAERPDRFLVARPFSAGNQNLGEYWKQPFVTEDPSDGLY